MLPEGCDYIIASHVVEHLPDIVKFLQEAERALSPTGTLSLAVPDMRLCFDVFRPITLLPDVLLANTLARRQPAPETIFAARAYEGRSDVYAGAWLPHVKHGLEPVGHLRAAYEHYLNQLGDPAPAYQDAHCWTFTPASFELLCVELLLLGLTSLDVVSEPVLAGAEFFVQLRTTTERPSEEELEVRRRRLIKAALHERTLEFVRLSSTTG